MTDFQVGRFTVRKIPRQDYGGIYSICGPRELCLRKQLSFPSEAQCLDALSEAIADKKVEECEAFEFLGLSRRRAA